MDCAKSLELLSDFHDELLDETYQAQVRAHLAECPPCECVFRDLDTIVVAAVSLRVEPGISFPDEELLWRRIAVNRRAVD